MPEALFYKHEQRKIWLFQDSVLYNGTIRENLDPDGQKSDKDLWDSLEEANLKDFVEGLAEKLEYNVGEGGDNLRFLTCYPFLYSPARKWKKMILIININCSNHLYF